MGKLRIYKLNEEGGGGAAGGGAVGGGSTSTSGSDIAGFHAPMLDGGSKFKNKRDKKKNNPKITYLDFINTRWKPKSVAITEHYNNDLVRGFEATLSSLASKAKRDKNSEGFALEDLDGNVIKVYVEKSQARDFRAEISSLIEDEYGNKNDIAEILYTLKDKYNIYDIEWPKEAIPKDEEEEESDDVETSEQVEEVDSEDTDESGEDVDANSADLGDLNSLEGTEEEAASLLSQIIDLMKQDISAKEAEARAKQAEAEARIAEKAEEMSKSAAKRTEQILDMEEFERRQKEEEEEEKLNKRLIKYRRAMGESNQMSISESTRKLLEALEEEPSYEEILDMEAWEEEERKNKERETLQRRLAKYRRAQRKKEQEALARAEEAEELTGVEDVRQMTLGQYIRANLDD